MFHQSIVNRARAWSLAVGSAASLFLMNGTAQANATFGSLSLIDSNGGSFLLSYTTDTSTPNTFTITLPNFAIGDLSSGSLSLGLDILLPSYQTLASAAYTVSGIFSGDGFANGSIQLTDSVTPANFSNLDSLSLPPNASGLLVLPTTATGGSISLALNLDTNGANPSTAGVSTISFTVQAVPEPGTYFAGLLAVALAGYAFRRRSARALVVVAASLTLAVQPMLAQAPRRAAGESRLAASKAGKSAPQTDMTEFARIAAGFAKQRALGKVARMSGNKIIFEYPQGKSVTDGGPADEGDDGDIFDPDSVFVVPGGQAEYSMAVDSTGMHVILTYNDTRGFSTVPVSVSGYYYSDDGGTTFTDGGQLPINFGAITMIGATSYPQVFGDTDVKYAGGSNFVVSSIMVRTISVTGTAQTMCVHRSTDFGHTWTGPFEVTAATNPTGVLTGVNARDAADKEFIDVDPSTGRVLMAWTNFTVGQSILATVSDNVFSATPPTWTTGATISPAGTGGPSGAQPRFKGDGVSAYTVFNDRGRPADVSGYSTNNIAFSKSTNNGATWAAPVFLTTDFTMLDQILGDDRVHSFPFMAVDRTTGASPTKGNIYVVWAQNRNADGGDIAFVRSTDGGTTFSSPVLLNSRPGTDRAQWFPTLTVDSSTGRIFVTYYDQGIATSGDQTEVTVVSSTDGGVTFTKPVPLTTAPFKAGWGNDTGQPNLGDYNYTFAQAGELFSVHAITQLKPYTDGQPTSGSFGTPDAYFNRTTLPAIPSVRPGAVTFTETGGNGFIDAGDQVQFTIPLFNYVTNASNAASVTGVSATLSTTTPGVNIVRPTSAYTTIGAGSTVNNTAKFVAKVAPNFVPGTPIVYTLNVTSSQGNATFIGTFQTGTPSGTVIFSENFDSTTAGSLPTGWSTSHAGGANTVAWTTSSTAFRAVGSPNNAAFHINANDGVGGTGNPIRFERLFSPIFSVPATGFDYFTIEMDVAYNTEEDPNYGVLAYDGFTLRVTDQTPGRLLRSVLLEAFADQFTTGNFLHFPRHLPRNGSTSYFQDMSVWGGFSNGFQHVRATIPANGFAGSMVQLRYEFTQDSGGTAFDIRPQNPAVPALATSGVSVDNIVIKGYKSVSVELAALKLTPVAGQVGKFTAVVTSQAIAPTGGITATLSTGSGAVAIPANATIPAGATTSSPFMVTVGPAAYNTNATITATGPTVDATPGNVRTATVFVRP